MGQGKGLNLSEGTEKRDTWDKVKTKSEGTGRKRHMRQGKRQGLREQREETHEARKGQGLIEQLTRHMGHWIGQEFSGQKSSGKRKKGRVRKDWI
jgi:hypothetical protein